MSANKTFKFLLNEDKRGAMKRILGMPPIAADVFHSIDTKWSFKLAQWFLDWRKRQTRLYGKVPWEDLFPIWKITIDGIDAFYPTNHSPEEKILSYRKDGLRLIVQRFMGNYNGNSLLQLLKQKPQLLKNINTHQEAEEILRKEKSAKKVNEENVLMKFDDGFFWLDLKTSHCDNEA